METRVKNCELISIPWASWFRFILFLASIVPAWYGFKAIIYFYKELGLGASQTYLPFQLVIIPWFFAEYIFVGLVFVCFAAWAKKGFSNLKSFKEEGLIMGLGFGLFVMVLIGGLMGGLIAGSIMDLTKGGLMRGLTGGHIQGLIMGLILGLFGGLLMGLTCEFERQQKRN